MTAQTKLRLKNWLLALLVSLLGWVVTTGWSVVDTRYVHQSDYSKHMLVDSIERTSITQKLDSANLRLQQIVCGHKLSEGCR